MNIQRLPAKPKVQAGFPVEQLYSVDGKSLRVDIEWKLVETVLAGTTPTVDSVQEALRTHHEAIERAVKARLFAQGFPLSNDLVLTRADFNIGQPT